MSSFERVNLIRTALLQQKQQQTLKPVSCVNELSLQQSPSLAPFNNSQVYSNILNQSKKRMYNILNHRQQNAMVVFQRKDDDDDQEKGTNSRFVSLLDTMLKLTTFILYDIVIPEKEDTRLVPINKSDCLFDMSASEIEQIEHFAGEVDAIQSELHALDDDIKRLQGSYRHYYEALLKLCDEKDNLFEHFLDYYDEYFMNDGDEVNDENKPPVVPPVEHHKKPVIILPSHNHNYIRREYNNNQQQQQNGKRNGRSSSRRRQRNDSTSSSASSYQQNRQYFPKQQQQYNNNRQQRARVSSVSNLTGAASNRIVYIGNNYNKQQPQQQKPPQTPQYQNAERRHSVTADQWVTSKNHHHQHNNNKYSRNPNQQHQKQQNEEKMKRRANLYLYNVPTENRFSILSKNENNEIVRVTTHYY